VQYKDRESQNNSESRGELIQGLLSPLLSPPTYQSNNAVVPAVPIVSVVIAEMGPVGQVGHWDTSAVVQF